MAETYCINHPAAQTRVKCSNCDSPICVKCMRQSAVGMKCPRCADNPRSARRLGKPRHYVVAAIAGTLVAMAAGAFTVLLGAGLFGILLPLIVGAIVGQVVKRSASGLSHTPIQLLAAAVTFVGLLGGIALAAGSAAAAMNAASLLGAGLAALVAAGTVGS